MIPLYAQSYIVARLKNITWHWLEIIHYNLFMVTSKNSGFILTDVTTSHSTKLSKDDSQVAGYAALRQRGKQASRVADARKKFLVNISTRCGVLKFSTRLADDSARAAFARSGLASPCGVFGRTLKL